MLLFDDIVNKAKQTADHVMDQSVDKVMGNSSDEKQQQQQTAQPANNTQNTTPLQTPAATSTKPKYDTNLVKSVQQQLKDQGYLSGTRQAPQRIT